MKRFWIGILLYTLSQLSFAAPLSDLVDLKGATFPGISAKSKMLIVFWATWCQDCRTKLRKELPELDRRADVAVITVNTDKEMDRAKDFVSKESISLPVLRDPNRKLLTELKIFSVPHWAVYERSSPKDNWRLVESKPAFDLGEVRKALGIL